MIYRKVLREAKEGIGAEIYLYKCDIENKDLKYYYIVVDSGLSKGRKTPFLKREDFDNSKSTSELSGILAYNEEFQKECIKIDNEVKPFLDTPISAEMRFTPITNTAYKKHIDNQEFLEDVAHYQDKFNDRPELVEKLRDRKDPKIIKQKLEKFDVFLLFEDSKYEEPKLSVMEEDFIKPILKLPREDKLISEFSKESADILKKKNTLFYRSDSKSIVEIEFNKDDLRSHAGFVPLNAKRFITLAEKYFIPGYDVWNQSKREYEFKKKSMSSELAGILLESSILQDKLPKINRIFTVPIPIMYEGKLTFPETGYDKRFNSWLPFDAPEIDEPKMPLEEAKKIIESMMGEFCFQDEQDKINAISSLLTPFLRGIFPNFTTRTPVSFYIANRERAGKDYLAGITGIVYEGMALEEPPISTSENAKSNNSEELRKKALASFISGKKRMHFANNKGHINNATFEAITTAEVWTDRQLGKNKELKFDNEIDFSLSGNVGVGFTPDFANRSRFIRLFLDIEDANARKFNNPNLHEWVKNNRSKILSALYSLVRNWIDKGMQKGSIPFASFPEWARVCGGIMEAAGYGNPCAPDKETLSLGGDSETNDMKELFEVCYNTFKERWVTKQEIRSFICNGESEIFSYLDLRGDNRSHLTQFGNKITKFIGRVLSDIRLVVQDSTVRAARQKLQFIKIKKEIPS